MSGILGSEVTEDPDQEIEEPEVSIPVKPTHAQLYHHFAQVRLWLQTQQCDTNNQLSKLFELQSLIEPLKQANLKQSTISFI